MVSLQLQVASELNPYVDEATPAVTSATVTLIVSDVVHELTLLFTVNVGATVSTTIEPALELRVIRLRALSFAHDTAKFNVPFVLEETSIVHSHTL